LTDEISHVNLVPDEIYYFCVSWKEGNHNIGDASDINSITCETGILIMFYNYQLLLKYR